MRMNDCSPPIRLFRRTSRCELARTAALPKLLQPLRRTAVSWLSALLRRTVHLFSDTCTPLDQRLEGLCVLKQQPVFDHPRIV